MIVFLPGVIPNSFSRPLIRYFAVLSFIEPATFNPSYFIKAKNERNLIFPSQKHFSHFVA